MNTLKSRRKYEIEKSTKESEKRKQEEQKMMDAMSEEEREVYKKSKRKRLKNAIGILSIATMLNERYKW